MRASSKISPYERGVYQLLAVFRFLFFALGVALTFDAPPAGINPLLLTGMVGVYTLTRVLYHLPIWTKGLIPQIILWGDLGVGISVVLLTGGLDSPFLLYSLVPILSAALLSQQGVALAFASLSSLALIFAHLVLGWAIGRFVWVLEGNYLAWLLIYIGASLLLVFVSYRTNINVRRRLEQETMFAERRRLRRELHDSLAQDLGFLKLKTSHLSDSASLGGQVAPGDLAEIKQVAERCYHDLREALDILVISTEEFSLRSALSRYLQSWSRRSGIPAELLGSPSTPLLPPATAAEVLRIVQEALSNVQKHSGARRASVEVKNTPEGISLRIGDDGCGFSPLSQRGHGLQIMEERAKSIGGTLSISSAPGQGTAITLLIPQSR